MPKATLICVFAWLLPGAGHLYFGRWARASIFFSVVILLFALGLHMDGRLFGWEPGFFGFLKFFGDAAVGIPYLIGRTLGWGSGDINSLSYEYGNTYLYSAGLLNMLIVLDAYDIAIGRKS